MKNHLFWLITFAIIATVVGVTVSLTQDFSYPNGNKIWIVKPEYQVDPWKKQDQAFRNPADAILHYYKSQHMEVYNIVKVFDEKDRQICEGINCRTGYTFSLLVDESDLKRFLTFGFHIVERNTVKNENKIWVVESNSPSMLSHLDQKQVQAFKNPADAILHYYKSQHIEVYDVVIALDTRGLFVLCEAVDMCPPRFVPFLLVGESDAELLLNLGFNIVEENATKLREDYWCTVYISNRTQSVDDTCSVMEAGRITATLRSIVDLLD